MTTSVVLVVPDLVIISLDCEGPIPIELDFVDPVSGREIPDWEGHHALGERKDVCGDT